jgi:hypothetical protein
VAAAAAAAAAVVVAADKLTLQTFRLFRSINQPDGKILSTFCPHTVRLNMRILWLYIGKFYEP